MSTSYIDYLLPDKIIRPPTSLLLIHQSKIDSIHSDQTFLADVVII